MLGVVGLVVGGIWSAASAVLENQRKSSLQTGMALLIQNIQEFMPIPAWPTENVAATDITSLLLSAGKIPSELLRNGQAVNPVSSRPVQVTLLHPPFYPSRYQIRIVARVSTRPEANSTMFALLQGQKSIASYAFCSNSSVDWVYNPPNTVPWPPNCPENSNQALVYYSMNGKLD